MAVSRKSTASPRLSIARVQVAPLAPDADVGLVDADRPAVELAEWAQPALDQRRVGQHPPVHGTVVDIEPALEQHLLNVAVAQWITQVPRDRLDDQPGLEMATLEVALGSALQLRGDGAQDHGCLQSEAANSVAVANEPLTQKFATGPRIAP